MNKTSYAIYLVLIIAVSFFAGIWYARRMPEKALATGGRRILYYRDPMHPAYKSDRPGIAPDCGMELEPVYDGDPEGKASPAASGTIQVSEDRQQLMGVKLAAVVAAPASTTLRTVGRVTPDENRIYRLLAGSEGWVREIHSGYTGSVVEKGQLLATVYNREMLAAEQALFFALNAMDRFKKEGMDSPEQVTATDAQIRAAEDNLKALGMGESQIAEIARTRKSTREIAVQAPASGLVVARSVFPGLKFERSTELYRLVDLSRVWILADLFQNEAQYFPPGTAVRVTIPHQQKTFAARVSVDPPQFDPNSRTLKTRLEADNPGFVLRPDMLVDVELGIRLPAAVTVPADAVIDSGMRQTVFVARGEGSFEARHVKTGRRYGDSVQVAEGLKPGEQVVVSGNFLLDSESRLRAAGTASLAKTLDPVCGMEVAPGKAAGRTTYKGVSYSFCSDQCKRRFDQNAESYLVKNPH